MTDDPVLADFAAEFQRCWLCGTAAINTWPPRLEIHHIVRGPNRKKATGERCALIRTCPLCHEKRLDGMDVTAQLAIKLRSDPGGYDRVRVNRLRKRADEAVTEGEVRVALIEFEAVLAESGYPFPRLL